ncbi:RING-type domain-containing protein [Aphelenchoides fujianensis]|nr:RING-type domain-containing protein [Aphelenchoides fujianensis]
MDQDNSTCAATSTVCSSPSSGGRPLFRKQESESSVLHVTESQLKCPMCKQFFLKPVTLCCGHTFCKSCAKKWLRSCTTCAVCRIPTLMPVQNKEMELILEEVGKIRTAELSTFQRAVAEPLRRTFRRGKPVQEIKAFQRESNRASIRRPKTLKFEAPKPATVGTSAKGVGNKENVPLDNRDTAWYRSLRKIRGFF